jgi:hypothetical protein
MDLKMLLEKGFGDSVEVVGLQRCGQELTQVEATTIVIIAATCAL